MPPLNVDLLRVATDRTYALGFSAAELAAALQTREFLTLNVTAPEVAQSIAGLVASIHGDPYQVQPPAFVNPSAQVADADLKVIRQPRIRTQGFGVVTGLGNYVEHMNVTNQIFMKALRSPHPHARVKAIDSSEAEKMPGVVKVLHRFNTPREFLNIKLGAGPPDRFLFPEEVFMAGVTV